MHFFSSPTTKMVSLGLVVLSLLCWRSAVGLPIEIGVSTSAYQIEGAVTTEGRTPSIWDDFCLQANKIADGHCANVSTDHYHRYKEDVAIMCDIGIKHYRFSISWSRLLPDPFTLEVNPYAVTFYTNLLQALREADITPYVTLFHWDLPRALQQHGGWLNSTTIYWMVKYSDIAFRHFGNQVPYWITVNEPYTYSLMGHGSGIHAPGLSEPVRAPYIAAHNLLLAHGKVYRHYQEFYKKKYGGQLSLALNSDFFIPEDRSNPNDFTASNRALVFRIGWFADPLFIGDYPVEMKVRLGSRLPRLNANQSEMLKGALDFFALNHYSSWSVTSSPSVIQNVFFDDDIIMSPIPGLFQASEAWQYVYPQGLYLIIKWLQNRYHSFTQNDLSPRYPIMITESGYSTSGSLQGKQDLVDIKRKYYLRNCCNQAIKVMNTLGINVTHYFIWSLLDNYEWADGYTQRFGLVSVNFSDNATRSYRNSAEWLRRAIAADDLDVM